MSMANLEGFIWFDGEMLPWQEAKIHVLTHTLHYGMGVFEGVRAYNTTAGTGIFRLEEHTERLLQSAHIMNIQCPYSHKDLMNAQLEAIKINQLPDAYIRPMLFYGSEAMGLRAQGLTVHAVVAAWRWPSYMSPEAMEKGIVVKTSSYTRHHVNISMCRAKANGHYINSMLALNEALQAGAEEALLLDPEGYVAEGSGENVFVVRDGILYTPELTACLDGITRRTVITLAKEENLQVIEKRITRDEVYIADEAFFTGTAAEVLPICELDGRRIGSGHRGPITERLQSLYFDCVLGKLPKHTQWITLTQ